MRFECVGASVRSARGSEQAVEDSGRGLKGEKSCQEVLGWALGASECFGETLVERRQGRSGKQKHHCQEPGYQFCWSFEVKTLGLCKADIDWYVCGRVCKNVVSSSHLGSVVKGRLRL